MPCPDGNGVLSYRDALEYKIALSIGFCLDAVVLSSDFFSSSSTIKASATGWSLSSRYNLPFRVAVLPVGLFCASPEVWDAWNRKESTKMRLKAFFIWFLHFNFPPL
jgi:hypothetical protein